jgi:hypothetical protein
MFTPEMFLEVNSKIVEEMPPFGLRTAIRAAALNITRITKYSKENPEIVMSGVQACFGVAAKQPLPPFAAKVRNLDTTIRHDDVKEILDRWADASQAFDTPSHEVKLAYGSMLALELVAALVREPRELQIVREILKMEMEQHFASQLTYTGESLMGYIDREAAELWARYPDAPTTDLSPLAFAALTILSRITQHAHSGRPNMQYINEVAVSIELLCKGLATKREAVGGVLKDQVDGSDVNAAIRYWSDKVSKLPNIDTATTLSAFAIEALAAIGARLSPEDRGMLFAQIPAHMIGDTEFVVVAVIGGDADNDA